MKQTLATMKSGLKNAANKHWSPELKGQLRAAQYLGVSVRTIRRWIDEGKLAPKLDGKNLVFRADELDKAKKTKGKRATIFSKFEQLCKRNEQRGERGLLPAWLRSWLTMGYVPIDIKSSVPIKEQLKRKRGQLSRDSEHEKLSEHRQVSRRTIDGAEGKNLAERAQIFI